jgi:hypothetical protein
VGAPFAVMAMRLRTSAGRPRKDKPEVAAARHEAALAADDRCDVCNGKALYRAYTAQGAHIRACGQHRSIATSAMAALTAQKDARDLATFRTKKQFDRAGSALRGVLTLPHRGRG